MPKLTTQQGLMIGISIIFIGILFLFIKACDKPVNQPVLDYNALKFSHDSLISVNKAITMNYDAFKHTALAKSDSLTKLLQVAVSKNTIAVGAISTTTSFHEIGKTLLKSDTVIVKGDSIFVFPKYVFDKTDSCEDVHVVATHDSTSVEFTVFNKQIIDFRYQPSGFLNLGKRSIVLEITNSNKRVRTTNQSSFVMPQSKSNRLLWFASGIIVASATYLYLKK